MDDLESTFHDENVSLEALQSSTTKTPERVVCSSTTKPSEGAVVPLSAPHVNMIFSTLDDAKKYYIEYGRQEGFSTRVRTTAKRKCHDGEVSSCAIVCAREGEHTKYEAKEARDPESPIKTRNSSTAKCGCKAIMRLTRRNDGSWAVTVYNDEHSHKLVSPVKRMRMKVNRVFPNAAKALVERFDEENLPVGKVALLLGGDSLGFNEKDCHNHLSSIKRKYKTPKDGDATAALSYFKRKSVEDPMFFHNIQTDSEGRAVNFFWVDGRSRAQYKHFGDVVVFDTTYKTNVYEMPFGPFTGVNHHMQSIQFGCALLLYEREESFIWLFETWLAAMGGIPPTSILTDQDRAMTAAVAKVFPTTRHRFCLWHIESKFPSHLAHVYSKTPTFKNAMNKSIWWPFRVTDFEDRWNKMLEKYELTDHDWLREIYQIRAKWAPVYFLDTFFAGMNTTSRSEGMNSVYKDYFTPSTTLREFLQENEKCLARIRQRERDADYDSEHTVRVVDKGLPLQKHAAKTYTRALYDKFVKQLEKAQYDYKIHSECPGEECTTYIIRSRKAGDTVEWEVTFSLAIGEGWCECKLFQFMGIPCGHILKVFLRHDLDEIPTFFLLRRWLQGANQYRSKDGSDIVNGAKGSNMQRLFSGFQLATEVVREAAEDQEDFTLLVDTLTALSETFATRQRCRKSQVPSVASSSYDKEDPNLLLNPKKSNANVTHHEERQDSDREDENENVVLDEGRQNMVNEDDEDTDVDMSQSVLLNPQVSQTKGRPRGNKTSTYVRQKSGLEKALEARKRKCNFCGIKGAGHDARNCELNPNRKVKRPNKAVSSGEPER